MKKKHGIDNLLICYSGKHTSLSGRPLDLAPDDIDLMADKINNIGPEHLPNTGVLFEKPSMKVGHGNTLVKHSDIPSVGKFGRARVRDMSYKGDTVRALFADIKDVPEGFFKMYEGGGFPAVSAEIAPNYQGQGPMVRAAAFLGMEPPGMKGQPIMDIYASLFSEGEEAEAAALNFFEGEDKELYTLNFSEFEEITEEMMNPDDVKKLIAEMLGTFKGDLTTGLKTELTAHFSEFIKPKPPEVDTALQAENDKLKKSIEDRDTADRNAKVVSFGEFVETLKEKEVNGQKLGLPPAAAEKVKALGISLADQSSEVCQFAEGDPMSKLEALKNVVKAVFEAKPLMFSEINDPNGDKTTAEVDRAAGKAIAEA